jgi:hypothetical protein
MIVIPEWFTNIHFCTYLFLFLWAEKMKTKVIVVQLVMLNRKSVGERLGDSAFECRHGSEI